MAMAMVCSRMLHRVLMPAPPEGGNVRRFSSGSSFSGSSSGGSIKLWAKPPRFRPGRRIVAAGAAFKNSSNQVTFLLLVDCPRNLVPQSSLS